VTYPSLLDYAPELAGPLLKYAQQDYEAGRGIPSNEDPPNDPDDRQLPPVTRPGLHALKAVGTGALGFGGGVLAGRGGYELLRKATGDRMAPEPWGKLAPVIGGAAGLAYTAYKEHELQELRRALQSHQNKPQGAGREPVVREPA
jgi:hypothetical protein